MNKYILEKNDSATCEDTSIKFTIEEKPYSFDVSEIDKVSIFTTDKGPLIDDVALAVFFDANMFLLPSEHPQYQPFLFDNIYKMLEVNYDEVIKSTTCVDNAEFVIYEKK